ncbi:MAG TPA: hypothetical protein VJN95_04935 [Gemmatimonadales bacterium]|nr:hypothetical protein [Gemmatimonadales bacterium]
MSAKPKPPGKADASRDLPLRDEQAKDVQGGKGCGTGTHLPETTITVK